jgi:hypothetical protein
MYGGCSGPTDVYVSCITRRSFIWTKICIFSAGVNKKGNLNLQGGDERQSKQDAWSEEIFSITGLLHPCCKD